MNTGRNFYQRKQDEAAEKLAALLALPNPVTADDIGSEGSFDPWEMLPCFFGTYSGAFDQAAILVLENIRDKRWGADHGEELAHEMFREALCTADLCDYGSSPRGCFPTPAFAPLLPELIQRWRQFSLVLWQEDVTA